MNSLKKKNQMFLSIDAEKPFDKIQYSFMLKIQRKVKLEGELLN